MASHGLDNGAVLISTFQLKGTDQTVVAGRKYNSLSGQTQV